MKILCHMSISSNYLVKSLLDSLIGETNLLEKEIVFQKVNFEYALGSINRNLAILKNF